MEAGAEVGADGGGVLFVHAEAELGVTGGEGLVLEPIEGEAADAVAVVLGEEVELAEEENGAGGLGFKTDVADGGGGGLDQGVADVALGHFSLHGPEIIPDSEHVIDLGLADDAGVVGGPDALGEVDDGGELGGGDEAEAWGLCGWGGGLVGELLAGPVEGVLPGGEVVGRGEFFEVGEDLIEGGLDEVFVADLFEVGGEGGLGEEGFGEVPAGPGAPGAEVFVGLDHAGGEVLPVAAGIAEELIGGGIEDEAGEGLVRERVLAEDGLVCGEGEGKGAIALEDALGGEAVLPEALGVAEAGEVEIGAALVSGEGVDVGGGVGAINAGEKGMGGVDHVGGKKGLQSRMRRCLALRQRWRSPGRLSLAGLAELRSWRAESMRA